MLKDRSGRRGRLDEKHVFRHLMHSVAFKAFKHFLWPKLVNYSTGKKKCIPLNSSDAATEEFGVNSFLEESTKEVTLAQLEVPYEEVFPAQATGGITHFTCLRENAAERRGWKGCLS